MSLYLWESIAVFPWQLCNHCLAHKCLHALLHCSCPSKTGHKSCSIKAGMLCSSETRGQDVISLDIPHFLLPQQESPRKVNYCKSITFIFGSTVKGSEKTIHTVGCNWYQRGRSLLSYSCYSSFNNV